MVEYLQNICEPDLPPTPSILEMAAESRPPWKVYEKIVVPH